MSDAHRTCREREAALALYVEDDLPAAEVGPLEEHLAACADCRQLLSDLRESQALVHTLADEPVDPSALQTVRTRLRARLTRPRRRPVVVGLWAAAAASVLLAAGLAVFALAVLRGDRPREARATAPSSPSVATNSAPAASGAIARSTPQPVKRVAAMAPRFVRPRPSQIAPDEAEVPLTPAEADQLARAVVLLSRIERLDDFRPEAETPGAEPSPAATARLATADPNVVIYWSFESNGGES